MTQGTGTTVLTKTAADGRAIAVTVTPHGNPQVFLNGESWTNGAVRERADSRPGITHAIGGPTRILGLTAAEAQQVRDGLARVTADWDATEEGQRSKLAIAVKLAGGEYSAASAAASDEDNWSGYSIARSAYEQALADLDAFDAAHPELAARIVAERAERDRENFEAGMRA